MKLTVVEGDITQQRVDAIVNAANERMRGGGGVDGAIHRAGGPAVLEDCKRVVPDGSRLPTGQAIATTAGNLSESGVRWVIHVVGPVYRSTDPEEVARRRELLVSCYAHALEVADELEARTVAFPLVSAGIYGWPLEDAIRAAIDTIRSTTTQVEEARLVAFGRSTYDAMMAAL
jgi:O-acetyl-ADP-ribose deacetylase (regulator of RNase III)